MIGPGCPPPPLLTGQNPSPSTSPLRFQTVYHNLQDTLTAADAEEDLKWFRSNHGPGMPMNWPQFEVPAWGGRGRGRVGRGSRTRPGGGWTMD